MKKLFIGFVDFMDFMEQNHIVICTILLLSLAFILSIPISVAFTWLMCNFPWLFVGIVVFILLGMFLYSMIDYFSNWR
uniref:Poxvirus virion envelope protein A14 n=1 Tax=Siphoviridae sp. ctZHD14 TaxID=2827891 RepID=A0A8S5SXB1_9CAUD|nr:MAG TPA: Poxvirus virion envelope protein A14 [Siphoviridae sp. ctZHD14]